MPLIRARSFGSSSRTEKSSLSPEALPRSFGLANVDSSSSSTTAIFLRPSSLDTIPPPVVAVAGALSLVSCPEGGFGFGFALDSPLFSRSVSSECRMISLNALRSSGGASLPLSATSMASSSDAARSRRSRRRASIAASSDASACPSLSFVEERDEDDSLSFVSSSASLAADLTCSSANTATADSMSDLSDAADAASSSSSSTTSSVVSSSPASIRAMAWTAR